MICIHAVNCNILDAGKQRLLRTLQPALVKAQEGEHSPAWTNDTVCDMYVPEACWPSIRPQLCLK